MVVLAAAFTFWTVFFHGAKKFLRYRDCWVAVRPTAGATAGVRLAS